MSDGRILNKIKNQSAKTAFLATADVSMEEELVQTLSALTGRAYATLKELRAADAAAVLVKDAEIAKEFNH